jgi:hypothetical protein
MEEIDTVIKAYKLYLEQVQAQGLEPMLSVTRAWRLVKFVDNGMLTMTKCTCCGGHYVTHPHEIARHYVCGLCNPPARAGKGRAAGALRIGEALAAAEGLQDDVDMEADIDTGVDAVDTDFDAAPVAALADLAALAGPRRAPGRRALAESH